MYGVIGYYLWRNRRGYRPAKKGSHGVKGFLRLTAYGVGVCTVLGALSVRSAKASVGDASMAVGRELQPLADVIGEATKIKLNGESMYLGNGLVSNENVGQVLDRFEQHCNDHKGPWADLMMGARAAQAQYALTPQGKQANLDKPTVPINGNGVYRKGTDGEGVVMCFAKMDGQNQDWKSAISDFAKTGDLGKLGKVRYAYARRTHDGSTHVLTVWTDESFNVSHVIPPTDGDAPGTDPTLAPRPPESKRTLTASVEKTPYGVHSYESAQAAGAVFNYYDDEMTRRGWVVITPPGEEDKMRAYSKGALEVLLSVSKDDNGTTVSIGEMGTE